MAALLLPSRRIITPQQGYALDRDAVAQSGTIFLTFPDKTLRDLVGNRLMPNPGGSGMGPRGPVATFNGAQQGTLPITLPDGFRNIIVAARIRATAAQDGVPGFAFGIAASFIDQACIGVGFSSSNQIGMATADNNGAYLSSYSSGEIGKWYTVFVQAAVGGEGVVYIDGKRATVPQVGTLNYVTNYPDEIAIGAMHRPSGFLRNFKGDIEWASLLHVKGAGALSLTDDLAARLYESGYPYNLIDKPRRMWVPSAPSWSDIPGATGTGLSASYITPTLVIGDNGNQYRLVATNSVGEVTSDPATLTVLVAPTITVQPTNQSTTVGSNATFNATVAGVPTPDLQWQEMAGSTSAAVITGTPQAFVLAITASPGAQSITVPADAEGVLVFYSHWTSIGNSLTSLSSDFADAFTIDQLAAVYDLAGTGIAYARVTSTGSKTLTPTWSTGHEEGPIFIVAFVKGITPSGAWIRDTFHGTAANIAVTGSVDSTVDDLVLALDSADDTTSPSTPSGWTSLQTQTANLATYPNSARLSSADSPGAATTSVSSQDSLYYPTLSMVSLLPGSASTWTDVTTGTGFTTGSWTSATQSTVGVTDIRLKATNSVGTTYSNTVTFTVTASGTVQIKYWTGSAWVEKPLKYWNGSSWVTKTIKRWNGTTWV